MITQESGESAWCSCCTGRYVYDSEMDASSTSTKPANSHATVSVAARSTGPVVPHVREQKRNKTSESLPKTLPGVVCAQRVRCGKPGCRCAHGQGHLAYYRFWREDGRLRKQYVRRADLPVVQAACEARRRDRRELSDAWGVWRNLVAKVREVSG